MAFSRHGLTSVSKKFVAVTPSNSANVPPGALGIYVGGAGNVVVTDIDGVTTTFTAVPVGALLPVSPVKITTASTATLMVLLY